MHSLAIVLCVLARIGGQKHVYEIIKARGRISLSSNERHYVVSHLQEKHLVHNLCTLPIYA
jgi:hypothetical protein